MKHIHWTWQKELAEYESVGVLQNINEASNLHFEKSLLLLLLSGIERRLWFQTNGGQDGYVSGDYPEPRRD